MEKSDLDFLRWRKYDGDYCKAAQDIKLEDGTIIENCWPNAGYWIADRGKHYFHLDAKFVRLSKQHYDMIKSFTNNKPNREDYHIGLVTGAEKQYYYDLAKWQISNKK